MMISQNVQDACLEMLLNMKELRPELRETHILAEVEMDRPKGERNLRAIMASLVVTSSKVMEFANDFGNKCVGEVPITELSNVFAEVYALQAVIKDGETSRLKNLNQVLIDEIAENFAFTSEIEHSIKGKFGENALMKMLTEDDLLPEFMERIQDLCSTKKTEGLAVFNKALPQ